MSNNFKTFIDGLDLPFDGEDSGDGYVIKVDNSDDFSELHTAISTNDMFNVDDGSIATENNVLFIYRTDGYQVIVSGDFKKDIYRITISEV